MRGVHITLRMRLECRIVRQRQSDNTPQELYEVLNEVVVDRGANPYLAKIECWERDTLITKVLLPHPFDLVRCCVLSGHLLCTVLDMCAENSVTCCHAEYWSVCSLCLIWCRSGASGWRDASNAHRQHSLLSGGRRVHGAPQRASHPLHPHLPALPLIQVLTLQI